MTLTLIALVAAVAAVLVTGQARRATRAEDGTFEALWIDMESLLEDEPEQPRLVA